MNTSGSSDAQMSLAAQALAALRESPAPLARSTSGLSVDEQLAVAQVGYEPLAVVSGSAVARLGYSGKWSVHPFSNYELRNVSLLLDGARRMAVTNMKERCAKVGAAGVIGVHLNLEGIEHDGLATFVATGTAVGPIEGNAVSKTPFTSSLSGQDFHLLLRGGCTPMGFVVGASTFRFGRRSATRWAASEGRCGELTRLTESLYAAREVAVERLGRQVKELGADGAVDVKVVERADIWGPHVIEFFAYGTAIALGDAPSASDDIPIMVLLNDVPSGSSEQPATTFQRSDERLTSAE
jgi:uncharacterized protein YbjQ (UPF0145 family)